MPSHDPRWGVSSSGVLALVEDFLRDASERTHARLGDRVAGVAITTAVSGGEPLTLGASTPLADEVDRLQYSIGQGPCLEALRGAVETYVPDLGSDRRWGRYGPEAAALGAHSCLSVPILDGEAAVLGVFKVYCDGVDGLDAADRRTVREFALGAAGGLALANSLIATSDELDDRIAAMDTRRTIDLATGILMARVGCGADDAFEHLRRESQQRNVKLHDVAADLVGRTPGARSADGNGGIGATEGTRTDERAPFRRRGEAPARGR